MNWLDESKQQCSAWTKLEKKNMKTKTKHWSVRTTANMHTACIVFRFAEYLDKDVYESQGCYDNRKDGSAGNYHNYGGERHKKGDQEHEHGRRQGLIDQVDVFGEAVDDASYGSGVKKRLECVKFVDEQVMVQLPRCPDVSHC